MGRNPTEPATPDLFSTEGVKGDAPSSPTLGAARKTTEPALQRHILPKNLRHAVSQLSDAELDELFEAAFEETKRRGRLPRSVRAEPSMATKRLPPTEKRRHMNIGEVALTLGQVNAVRAAFKAGVTPSRIARQFGISQSNVRKALASNPSK
jgi:predicted DNA-binding protein (UPF0251 family)